MSIAAKTTTVTSGAFTTSFTLSIDSGVTTGDILVLGVTNRGGTADPTVTDDDSGGNTWTKLLNQAQGANGSMSVWWKRATSATASKTITVSGATDSVAGVLTPYSGASNATSPFGTPVSESNASTNFNQAGITVGRAGSFVLVHIGITHNDTDDPNTVIATDPTALTERGSGQSTGGNDCEAFHASAVKSTTGATGTISWSQTVNGQGCSSAIELFAALDNLTAGAGSFALTGSAATLTRTYKLTAESGTLQATGTAAGLTATRLVSPEAGSFALTGSAVAFPRTYKLTPEAGVFDLEGSNVSLEYTPGGAPTTTPRHFSMTMPMLISNKVSMLVKYSRGRISS